MNRKSFMSVMLSCTFLRTSLTNCAPPRMAGSVTPASSPSPESLPTPSGTVIPVPGTESPLLPLATLTVIAPKTYRDPDLGFGLRYDASWRLHARAGTALNDGSGRTISLEKDGYQFKMMIQNKPRVVGACAGLLPQDTFAAYWKYTVGNLERWQAKAEAGFVNSYSWRAYRLAACLLRLLFI